MPVCSRCRRSNPPSADVCLYCKSPLRNRRTGAQDLWVAVVRWLLLISGWVGFLAAVVLLAVALARQGPPWRLLLLYSFASAVGGAFHVGLSRLVDVVMEIRENTRRELGTGDAVVARLERIEDRLGGPEAVRPDFEEQRFGQPDEPPAGE